MEAGQRRLAGNISAIGELADRAEGRPGTSVSINEGEDPIAQLIAGMEKMSAQLGPPEGHVPLLTSDDDVPEE